MFFRLTRYKNFKEGHKRILVATDLVGRGIDIERVNIVINYDMPDSADTYLHRVCYISRDAFPSYVCDYLELFFSLGLSILDRLVGLVGLGPKGLQLHLSHLHLTLMFLIRFARCPYWWGHSCWLYFILLVYVCVNLSFTTLLSGSREVWGGYKGTSWANWYFNIQYVSFLFFHHLGDKPLTKDQAKWLKNNV